MRLLILVLCFTVSSTFAQSKADTAKEILGILEQYQNDTKTYKNDIRDGYICKTYKYVNARVKLKHLTKVMITRSKFEGTDDEGWVTMSLYFDPNTIEFQIPTKSPEYATNPFEQESRYDYLLRADFLAKGGMKEKLEKAILHLVELHGGSAVVEEY